MSTIIRSEQDYIEDLSATDNRLIHALQGGNVEMAIGCLQNMAIMAGLMLDAYGDNYNEDARRRVCANLSRTADNVAAQRHDLRHIDKDMLVEAITLTNKIMDEQGFPDLKNLFQFEDFKAYTRGMLTQIANAKIGQFHHARHMREAVIVWRPGEGPALDYYPAPENITHIKTEPAENPVDSGNYAFKHTLSILFEKAGAKKNLKPEISYARKGEFNLTMHADAYSIHALFIRYNGPDFIEKLKAITSVDDKNLHEACRRGCLASCAEIQVPPTLSCL